jgi:hypothetical protein
MRVGIADHFGWAVAVTADDDHAVVDRRRIELVEPGVCAAPIHYESARLSVEATAELVASVRASVARAAARSFDALPGPVGSISLRTWPPDFPTSIEVQRRSPWEARADAVMYRQILAELAHERGWDVHLYDARSVVAQAEALLGPPGLARPPGPPWTKDHRVALAATVVTLGIHPDHERLVEG